MRSSLHEFESTRQARRSIGMIRQKLLKPTPEALDGCMPHLRVAIASITRLQQDLTKTPGLTAESRKALHREMAELGRELAQVSALVRNAGGFYGGLARLLAPPDDFVVGYAASGVISSRPVPTLQLEG